ncbi:hypothetical protein HUU62_15235 [Rhodoferax sp. 4810]|nr:hypothetical protein [Rhodoferax jenense]
MSKLPKSKQSAHDVPPELEGFSFQASADFIEFELTLAAPSQWHPLKRRADKVWGNSYVESLERNESSHSFRLRVQNPRSPDEFMRQVQCLQRQGETLLESAVRITGVEISLDARHPSNDPAVLAPAALYLARHHAHLPRGFARITAPPYFDAPNLAAQYAKAKADHAIATANALRDGAAQPPKFQRKRGTRSVVESNRQALTALQSGLTINQGKAPNDETGDRGDSHRGRHYVKTNDTRDGIPYAPLPPKDFSARSEKTLIDADVPFTTIEEWRNFRYESLSRRFELVKPNPSVSPLVGLLQDRVTQFGFNADELCERPRHPEAVAKSREPGYRRTFRRGTHPDTAVNDMIRKALWCLTERSRVKIRKVSEATQLSPSEVKPDLDGQGPEYSNTNTVKETEPGKQSLLTKATHTADRYLATHTNTRPSLVRKQVGKQPNQCGPPRRTTSHQTFIRLLRLPQAVSPSLQIFPTKK